MSKEAENSHDEDIYKDRENTSTNKHVKKEKIFVMTMRVKTNQIHRETIGNKKSPMTRRELYL